VKVCLFLLPFSYDRRGEGKDRVLTKTEQEPYDSKLALTLKSLSAQIEHLTLHLATLRREAPAKAAVAYTSTLNDNDSSFTQARISAEQNARNRIQEEEDLCGVKGVRDWDECEKSWKVATEGLVDVKEGIGATGARLVQARDVAGYLEEKTVR
jgi:kinetochor protein Mis14/NSL1